MKKIISILSAALLASAVMSVTFFTGCATQTTPGGGTVTVIDAQKLQQVQGVIEPAASAVIRRAILNSPQHANEIGEYARTAGRAVCSSIGTQQISPSQVIAALDTATQSLQFKNLPPEVIDAKNALEGVYTILWNDKLTTQLPNNQWPYAVLQTICDSLDKALKDAGQAGIK